MKDYYKELGVNFSSDISTIKKAFRQLALKYHPDKNKDPHASAKFIEIIEAYEVLNNETKKREYDNLYLKHQVNEENIKNERTQEWANYGTKMAEEYASMSFDDFADRIIDELKLGISYTPNMIFILLCLIGVIGSIYFILIGSFLLGIIMMVFYGPPCYFLYRRAKIDYIKERRIKILNKYK